MLKKKKITIDTKLKEKQALLNEYIERQAFDLWAFLLECDLLLLKLHLDEDNKEINQIYCKNEIEPLIRFQESNLQTYEILLWESIYQKRSKLRNQISQLYGEIYFFIRWQELDLQRFIAKWILTPGIIIEDTAQDFCVWDGCDFINVKRPRSREYLTIPHMVICPVCRRARPFSRKHFFRVPFLWNRIRGAKRPLEMFEKLYLKPCEACESEYRKILQKTKKPRLCLQCGNPISNNSAPKKKFCSETCRVRHHRAKEYVKKLNK